jgi:hypothetical protein
VGCSLRLKSSPESNDLPPITGGRESRSREAGWAFLSAPEQLSHHPFFGGPRLMAGEQHRLSVHRFVFRRGVEVWTLSL